MNKHIIIDQSILLGKPIIAGTRISVELILKMLAQGVSHQEILIDYPDLSEADILATLEYAHSTVAEEEVYHVEPAIS